MMAEFASKNATNGSENLAHVVMPDHIHWLMQLCAPISLDKIVGRLKGRSARQINLARKYSEPVWQRGFHDHALRSEEAIEDVATYLIYNPVRAGLVSDVNDYPYWQSIWHSRG
jgi:REP element-mobilizing transposase RayT